MNWRRTWWTWGAGLCLFLKAADAPATYSLIAQDTNEGKVGGFAVSCVGTDLSLSEVLRVPTGSTVMVAQGLFFAEGRDALEEALRQGSSANAALDAVLAPDFDPSAAESGPAFRQYALIDSQGNTASHSGMSLESFAGGRTGTVDGVVYGIQGNVLTGVEVLDTLEMGFSSTKGSLEERLVASLDAVADGRMGDTRCSPETGDAGVALLSSPGWLAEFEQVDPDTEVAQALADDLRSWEPLDETDAPGALEKTRGEDSQSSGCTWAPHSAPLGAPFAILLSVGAFALVWSRRSRSGAS